MKNPELVKCRFWQLSALARRKFEFSSLTLSMAEKVKVLKLTLTFSMCYTLLDSFQEKL